MEDSMSFTNNNFKDFYDVAELDCSSEDSSWSLYIEDFITSSIVEDSAVCSGSKCSLMSPDAVYMAKKMCAKDDQVASARSVAKRRKTIATYIDHDLEDTASSPVCSSKVQISEHSYIQLQETDYGLNTLQPEQLGKHDYRSFSQEKWVSDETEETMHLSFIEKDIKYTGLRKTGLCLVPVSMLLNFC